MARRVSRESQEQVLMEQWWMRALLGVAFLGLAYAFASFAIDSGNLLEYIITLILVWWGIKHLINAFRFAFR